MARIRSLKPEIWMSPQVMNLSHGARLLFVGLITQADDEGRGTADPRRVKAAIFGGDDCTSDDVRRWLDECSTNGLVVVYQHDAHGSLFQLPSWKSHQSIDRPRKSAYPSVDDSSKPRRTLDESSTGIGREGKGREGIVDTPKPDSTSPRRALDEFEYVGKVPAPGDLPAAADGGSTTSTPTEAEWMNAWAMVRHAYPKRSGRQHNWLLGERYWRALVDDGVTDTVTLQAGVDRYAAYVRGGGITSDQYVLGIDTFFGAADKPWAQAWTLPKAGDDGRIAANIAAGQEWLAKGGT